MTLAVAGRSNATPSVATDGEFVAVAWGASLPSGATDVFLATSVDGGRTFAAPVRVNDRDGDARLNGEQPPRVVLQHADPPIVSVVWTTKGEQGTRLVYARSENGGRSFTRAAIVPGSDAPGNRGWQGAAVVRRPLASPASTSDGGKASAAARESVDVVWLDHRELARQESMATMHHEHAGGKPDGVAMAQKSKLYVASLDGSIAAQAVTGGVCYCCKTAITSAADGSIQLAWRHVFPGNIRDIAFTVSRDGGRTFAGPVRVSEDKWELEGCPDDGPAMAVDNQGRIHIVWPTLVTETTGQQTQNIALFYAMSVDGRSFSARQRISTQGTPHHPQIAVAPDGSLRIAWDELVNGGRIVEVARATPDANGQARIARVMVTADVPALYPVVAVTRQGTLVAYTAGKSSDSTVVVTRVP